MSDKEKTKQEKREEILKNWDNPVTIEESFKARHAYYDDKRKEGQK